MWAWLLSSPVVRASPRLGGLQRGSGLLGLTLLFGGVGFRLLGQLHEQGCASVMPSDAQKTEGNYQITDPACPWRVQDQIKQTR